MIERVVSGGQTGVDRAALDIALALKIACGGWCPQGRLAEDGPLSLSYPLRETPLPAYAQRTEWNVRDADGTLILHAGELSGGTAFTVEMAQSYGKPHLLLNLMNDLDPDVVREWVREQGIRVLNVAGPRESGCPGIYERATDFLRSVLKR